MYAQAPLGFVVLIGCLVVVGSGVGGGQTARQHGMPRRGQRVADRALYAGQHPGREEERRFARS